MPLLPTNADLAPIFSTTVREDPSNQRNIPIGDQKISGCSRPAKSKYSWCRRWRTNPSGHEHILRLSNRARSCSGWIRPLRPGLRFRSPAPKEPEFTKCREPSRSLAREKNTRSQWANSSTGGYRLFRPVSQRNPTEPKPDELWLAVRRQKLPRGRLPVPKKELSGFRSGKGKPFTLASNDSLTGGATSILPISPDTWIEASTITSLIRFRHR